MIHLILGGARSGKSGYAEKIANELVGDDLVYLATGQALDDEMEARIAHHKANRNPEWDIVEEPCKIGSALNDHPDRPVLVDCLTLWLSNCLHHQVFEIEKNSLFENLKNRTAPIWFISNEVGSGIVPLGELSRQFVDEAGRLHQELAKVSNDVTLVVAGLPLKLK